MFAGREGGTIQLRGDTVRGTEATVATLEAALEGTPTLDGMGDLEVCSYGLELA